MPIFDLFSKRRKEQAGKIPEVFTYGSLPDTLRVQIIHIWQDTIGGYEEYNDIYGSADNVRAVYKEIIDILCREYGMFQLPTANQHTRRMYLEELCNYFLQVGEPDRQIDIVEWSFRYIDKRTRDYRYLNRHGASELADDAILELNERFKQHGLGYQFVSGEIVRVDSELIHIEAVKPAIRLLNEKCYKGAQEEFLSAFEHYRHARYKEALNDCLKSFESTMKAICDKRKWRRNENATASTLVQLCFEKGLVPAFWQQELGSLRSLLESGIPTGRNRLSGHGQGATPTSVPDYLVAYMLHMTASTIVFLTMAEKNLK